ncbi:hypothetical protein TYRP_007077 [Tyrophagus putrescentiae]|nr:hypothetical protein TYRP_007077 [Tyrophagus putrescentiae]
MPGIVADMIEQWEENDRLDFHLQLRELYDDIQMYMWATLDNQLREEDVLNSTEVIRENSQINIAQLQENIEAVNLFISTRPASWATLSTSERWLNLLNSVSGLIALEKAASFILTLPGTNATIERLFSEIKNFWTDSKDSMTLATVNTIMKIRYNYERDCQKVLQMLVTDTALRRKVRENNKYEEAKLKEAHFLVNIMEQYGQEEEEEWEDFFNNDQSSNTSDPSYEENFSSDEEDDDYLDEEISQSEQDRLNEDDATGIRIESEVIRMEVENDPQPDRLSPTPLDCLMYEHNYEASMEIESPWHR